MGEHSTDSGRRATIDFVLVLVVLVATVLVAFKVAVQVHVGPGWDSYAFLANAAEFAGRSVGYAEPHRPPVVSFLTSLVFRVGPMHESVLQILDGVLTILGVAGFYLLFRKRFSKIPSAVGALAFLAVQPLWNYLGMGYTDFAAVGLSAWALLLCINATERDARWYLAAIPMLLVAALTRYTALLFVFVAAVWILLRWRPFRQAGRIALGTLLAAVVYVPAGVYYAQRFGDALFPFVVSLGFAEGSTASAVGTDGAVEAAGTWYLENAHAFLSPEGLGIIAAIVLVVAALGLVSRLMETPRGLMPAASRFAIAILGVAPAVVAQLYGGMIVRQVTIPVAVFAVWRALAPREGESPPETRTLPGPALDAAMLTWLLVFLDFHSGQVVQVPRYFITMAPALIYFTLLGWQSWMVTAKQRLSNRETGTAVPRAFHPSALAWAALAAWIALAVGLTVWNTPVEQDQYVAGAKRSADALLAREEDPGELVIYSDLWPLTSWYVGSTASPMPFFEEDAAFAHELEKYAADYFATIRARRFDGFEDVSDSGSVVLLQRVSDQPRDLPSVQYLGKSWENYLETVSDYSFDLMYSGGRYGYEGSAYLDAYSSEELAEHDAVALYGVRWRDRAAGEAELVEYVENGGALVIDASANLGTMANDLGDTVMFDTVIRRGDVPPDATLHVTGDFAERHPGIADLEAAPFVDESGGAWHGAQYEPLPGADPLEVLVSVGGKPAVAMRRAGQGRVYWIGYNLVWHAFITENAGEQRLIEAVFEDALCDDGMLCAEGGAPTWATAER